MKFSNKFKIYWWAGLLLILTILSAWRLYVGVFNNFDICLFVFWFILVLFPIISEISIFGLNVKKDIEAVKSELKTYIAEIKNQIDFRPTINLNTDIATNKEYKEKARKELKEENKYISKKRTKKSFALSPSLEDKRTSINKRTQERLNKLLDIEKLVNKHLLDIYGEYYKSQMKLEDTFLNKNIIADGLIFKGDSINEIVEIKFITNKSFDNVYYIALRFAEKVFKLGLRIPIRFIIVSEDMNETGAKLIKEQIKYLNYNRHINRNLPKIDIEFFKLKAGELIEIKIKQTHEK
ncbi:hypothetical protein ES703_85960 [subsurface metagenome]